MAYARAVTDDLSDTAAELSTGSVSVSGLTVEINKCAAEQNEHIEINATADVLRWKLRCQKHGVQPPQPSSLSTVDLLDEMKTTGNKHGRPFLIQDSGAKKKILFDNLAQI